MDVLRSELSVQILGPVVAIVHGNEVRVTSGKARGVLACLAVEAGRVVTVDRLADALWGDHPPATSAQTLQVHVSNLRRTLGAAASIDYRPPGYVLHLDPAALDAARFETIVHDARELLAAGSPNHAAAALAGGLATWRGDALADVRGSDVLDAAAVRLDELRVDALELRFEAMLAAADHVAAIPEIETAIARAPYRERLRECLMLALYRSGRQRDALRSYQVARDLLLEDLGVDPGPHLREMESAILRQDPGLATPDPPGSVPDAVDASSDKRTIRKVATVVVVVPAGSDATDPERYATAHAALVDTLATAAATTAGAVRDSSHGAAAWFGVPLSRVDDATRATAAARLALQLAQASGVSASAGVATGVVVLAGDPRPSATEARAGALATTASAGEVRCDDATTAVLPVDLPPGPLVGRGAELAALRTHVAASGKVPLLLRGDAGMGKSRLLAELFEELGSEAGAQMLHCRPAGAYDNDAQLRDDGPTVLVDDAQWAAPELLAQLGDMAVSGVAVVAAAREEMPIPAGWSTLELGPLGDDAAREFVEGVGLDPDQVDGAIAVAAGNAWFLRALAHSDVAMAGSLHAFARARVDQLEPYARAALQAAAVVSGGAPIEALRAVASGPLQPRLDALRAELVSAGMLRADPRIDVSHDLICEAALETMPLETRAASHEAYARWLLGRVDAIERLGVAAIHLGLAADAAHALRAGTASTLALDAATHFVAAAFAPVPPRPVGATTRHLAAAATRIAQIAPDNAPASFARALADGRTITRGLALRSQLGPKSRTASLPPERRPPAEAAAALLGSVGVTPVVTFVRGAIAAADNDGPGARNAAEQLATDTELGPLASRFAASPP